jgi:hypothetical protein
MIRIRVPPPPPPPATALARLRLRPRSTSRTPRWLARTLRFLAPFRIALLEELPGWIAWKVLDTLFAVVLLWVLKRLKRPWLRDTAEEIGWI